MSDLFIYILVFSISIFILFTASDIHRSKLLTKREKTNNLFLILVIPFGGSLIYYLYLKKQH